jgi:hypothetical protein
MFTQNLLNVFILCLQGLWWTEQRLPFSLVLFHPHIAQVLSLAILSEFISAQISICSTYSKFFNREIGTDQWISV